jgi:excisionase family DNA binding protein
MAVPQQHREFVKLRDFAKLSPVSESTIRRWVTAGKIEHIQPGNSGTTILIPLDALTRIEAVASTEGSIPSLGPVAKRDIPGRLPQWKTNQS